MPRTQVNGLPREDVRLSFTAPSGTAGWILIDDLANLHVADAVEGNIRYRRSDFELPPWAVTTMVTSGGQDSEPRFTIWKNRRVILFWTRATGGGGSDVYWTTSQSDGLTFKTESLFVASAKHPTCNTGRDGELFAAYYQSGNLFGRWRDKGDAALSSPFAFVDSSGAALQVEDDCFHFAPAQRHNRAWELFVRILGETTSSLWRSNNYPPSTFVRKS